MTLIERATGEAGALLTKNDLAIATNNLTHEIKQFERRMVIKMGGMLGAAIGILTAVIKIVK